MSDGTRAHPHAPHVHVFNTDGQRHPVVNGLAVFALAAGIVSFATTFQDNLHVLSSCAGMAALVVGLYAQMVSATRTERMVIVTGLVAGFVGLALGLAHGGFYP